MNKLKLLVRPLVSPTLRFVLCLQWLISAPLPAAAAESNPRPAPAPRLVVGIVVDQMRYDFIYRYWDKYTNSGFKRLLREGTFYRNAQYNYAPTYTGPGHASIFTGATPSAHGIAGNDWYDRNLGHYMYCAEDTSVTNLGGRKIVPAGQRSPTNLNVTTITDELKLAHTNSRVIGVSLKDRAAIFPAGHLANAAYWFDSKSGQWISSSYYAFPESKGETFLPEWLRKLNSTNNPGQYLTKTWEPIDKESFTESASPKKAFSNKLDSSENHLGFPHNLAKIAENFKEPQFEQLLYTPYGNKLTADFAKAAVIGEKLGQCSDRTDFLTINFASTDYAGHRFGPRSQEVEDVYREFDRELGELLTFLSRQAGGPEHLLVFLTADHGVADVPEFSKDLHLPGGRFPTGSALEKLNAWIAGRYQKPLILGYTNQQIYLDRDLITAQHLDLTRIEDEIRDRLLKEPGVIDVLPTRELPALAAAGTIRAALARGIYPNRSGDLMILLGSGWLEEDNKNATSHGTPYQYDTHVPIIFWGWQVPPHREFDEPVDITQIAPTVAQMLNIQFPSASDNRVLPGLLGIHAKPGTVKR